MPPPGAMKKGGLKVSEDKTSKMDKMGEAFKAKPQNDKLKKEKENAFSGNPFAKKGGIMDHAKGCKCMKCGGSVGKKMKKGGLNVEAHTRDYASKRG
jgi:hypothetical protein